MRVAVYRWAAVSCPCPCLPAWGNPSKKCWSKTCSALLTMLWHSCLRSPSETIETLSTSVMLLGDPLENRLLCSVPSLCHQLAWACRDGLSSGRMQMPPSSLNLIQISPAVDTKFRVGLGTKNKTNKHKLTAEQVLIRSGSLPLNPEKPSSYSWPISLVCWTRLASQSELSGSLPCAPVHTETRESLWRQFHLREPLAAVGVSAGWYRWVREKRDGRGREERKQKCLRELQGRTQCKKKEETECFYPAECSLVGSLSLLFTLSPFLWLSRDYVRSTRHSHKEDWRINVKWSDPRKGT